MIKYGPVTEKQIDILINFMENHLLRRKFTLAEADNMRQVLHTFVHIVQLEVISTIGNELENNLNEDNAPLVPKFVEMLKSLKAFCQPPPF